MPHITLFFNLVLSRRQIVAIDGAVTPSAASTQVVPHGGKGSTAAEGKTKKTRAAIRRVDVGRIEDGAVGVGRGIRCT